MPATPRNNIIGKPFVELSSIDSTNNYAMRQIQKGLAQHGTAYFALEQTEGKGQRNKQWQSAKEENIILSIVLNTNTFSVSQQFLLSMAAALSAHDLFNKYTTNKTFIKWPNDIYWDDRKAAGILIESVIRGGQWRFAVIGFGININQTVFDDALKNPVSMKQITGKTYDVRLLAEELCEHLQNRLTNLQNGEEKLIVADYNEALYRKNLETKFKSGSRIFNAFVKHVDRYGRLVVGDSIEESFASGEVEWLIN